MYKNTMKKIQSIVDRDFKLNKGCYSMFMNVKMQYSKKITSSKLTYRFITISEKL